MDPDHFLMIVLSRFELFHIFSSADIRKRYRETNKVSTDPADVLLMSEGHIWAFDGGSDALVSVPQDLVQQNTLIEEMLHLIIMIVGECFWTAGTRNDQAPGAGWTGETGWSA